MTDLSPKQIAVVAALLAGKSIEASAQEAEVAATTVHRWFRESDAFNDALSEGRRAALHTAVNTLSVVARSAVGVVAEILSNKKTPPSVRLRAALGVLDLLMQWTTHQDLDDRIRRLEVARTGTGGTDGADDARTTPAA